EPGIGVAVDRDLARGGDARIVVGVVAHVGLAHVGLRQHAADRGVAAGHQGLEALGLDDARRQRVISAGHQDEPIAGHDLTESLADIHVNSSLSAICSCGCDKLALILRRLHALACDRLEGWPQVPDRPPSFETHCARQLATAMLLRMRSESFSRPCTIMTYGCPPPFAATAAPLPGAAQTRRSHRCA